VTQTCRVFNIDRTCACLCRIAEEHRSGSNLLSIVLENCPACLFSPPYVRGVAEVARDADEGNRDVLTETREEIPPVVADMSVSYGV